ncbi:MAG: HAD-IA family hydrolase [Marinobacter sp.]|nr:HAD-IA family hydrolase [Marinobacter sp.]
MTFKVVIFDWDGTVVDSVEHITDSLQQAAADLGFDPLARAAYRDIIGLGMVEALNVLYPGIQKSDMMALRDRYGHYFFQKLTTPQQVFAGMDGLLSDLRHAGVGRAVATGKSRRGLDAALQSSGLGSLFEVTRCADETRSKPDPLMLEQILSHYRLAPDEVVMVGDTVYDLDMAARIGMPSVGVEWGVHDREALHQHQPHAVVNTVDDLRRALGLS